MKTKLILFFLTIIIRVFAQNTYDVNVFHFGPRLLNTNEYTSSPILSNPAAATFIADASSIKTIEIVFVQKVLSDPEGRNTFSTPNLKNSVQTAVNRINLLLMSRNLNLRLVLRDVNEIQYDKGIDLAEMNAILLRQIEELTLRVIELNKKIEKLEK